jgi:hypothetical protein
MAPMSQRDRVALDRAEFYRLMSLLSTLPNQARPLAQLGGNTSLPERGVYFFREPGEVCADGSARIVRVGTHAVSSGSKSTLRSRLKTHLGSKSGSGNHRGSIFRLHLGNAMLVKNAKSIPTWGKGSVAPPELRGSPEALADEAAWEKKVSQHIGAMEVLWVDVPDEPSSESERAFIERNAIGLLSERRNPALASTTGWLGEHSHREEIRSSRLWNLRHIDEQHDVSFLGVLASAIERTAQAEAR